MRLKKKEGPAIYKERMWSRRQDAEDIRDVGTAIIGGFYFIVCDKYGRDIFELREKAEAEGKTMAIEAGEPCDLIRRDLIPAYRILGRNEVLRMAAEGASAKDIKFQASQVMNNTNKV